MRAASYIIRQEHHGKRVWAWVDEYGTLLVTFLGTYGTNSSPR